MGGKDDGDGFYLFLNGGDDGDDRN